MFNLTVSQASIHQYLQTIDQMINTLSNPAIHLSMSLLYAGLARQADGYKSNGS